MNKTPAVSVVLPVFNGGALLEETVKSIFAQTLSDWELIAIDDASTDGSGDYLRTIDDPRVRVYRNERNLNQASSINRGVSLARAPYVALQDADDLSLPPRIEKQLALLEAHPELDVVSAAEYATHPDLTPFLLVRSPPDHASITRRPTLVVRMTHHTAMGRLQWWKRWPYDPRARICQDFDLWLRSFKESTFGNVLEPLYAYRTGGITHGMRKYCLSTYYKSMSVLRHGFRQGLYYDSLLALASMPPRIVVTAARKLLGMNPGLTKFRRIPPTEEEAEYLAEQLAVISSVKLPLKSPKSDAPAQAGAE